MFVFKYADLYFQHQKGKQMHASSHLLFVAERNVLLKTHPHSLEPQIILPPIPLNINYTEKYFRQKLQM
jgi:hypothetical protein